MSDSASAAPQGRNGHDGPGGRPDESPAPAVAQFETIGRAAPGDA